MTNAPITFDGHDGAPRRALLETPDGPHLATALFVHCFPCNDESPAARRISARLAALGIAVLRCEFPGPDRTEDAGFAAGVADIAAAARHLDARGMAPSLLIGHSRGGAGILMASGQIPSALAVATLGAPLGTAPAHGDPDAGCPDAPPIPTEALTRAIRGLKRALLVLHAPLDRVVGIANARAIFDAAMHPKSFVTLDGADHQISDPADAEYAAGVIAAWAERYLNLAHPAPPPGAPEGVVRVSEADPEGFLQDVQAGQTHHALADEPEAYGGSNRGMSPYGFLAAGLGACTSMTIRMYARRKGWPLTHVRVDVTHGHVHAQDASGAGSDAKIDCFRREIHLEGELDAGQRARLLEIADKCPVHRTLTRSSRIETVLAGAADDTGRADDPAARPVIET